MGKHENWRGVDCPACGVKAGSRCFFAPGSFGMVHPKRKIAAERAFGKPAIALPVKGLVSPAHKRKTRFWSKQCREGRSDKCSGFRRAAYEGLVSCENPAHAIVMINDTTDFRTVDDSASTH